MKKKTINKITLGVALGLGLIFLISCTANFATNVDKANIMYSYDMGSLRYADGEAEGRTKLEIEGYTFDNVYYWQDFEHDYTSTDENPKVARTLNVNDDKGVVYAAKNSGIAIPSNKYWELVDKNTLKLALDTRAERDKDIDKNNITTKVVIDTLERYGAIKFYDTKDDGSIDNWKRWDALNQDMRDHPDKYDNIELKDIPTYDFSNLYKSFLEAKAQNVRSCIAIDTGQYGNFGWNHNRVWVEGKDWGSAWGRGFLEGLLVYPVAAMTEIFSHTFGMGGFGQLGAILLVTFIVRSFLALVSLKSTIGQQKMQMLQPELAKIQAKYPNANTNQAEKQRMSQEQMALYKKNKINPLGTLVVLIVQFPLFIAVWGGLQGSAALATDQVWGLYLSESIWNTLTNTQGLPSNVNGWWTAFTLFILMAVAQFVSMKLPQWMQKHREKKMPKLSANPAQNKQQKQMKWFGYIMLVIIIIMGFTLPAGMGVYWLAGALFSILQTTITQLAISGTFKRWFYKIKKLIKKDEVNNNENI